MDLPQPPKGNFYDKNINFMFTNCNKKFIDFLEVKQICYFLIKDSALRNIIDKLAEFVARNGPEFEAITKAKQQGNPKFEFLYGGEFYMYYQWRVQTEQASKK